MHGGVNRPFMPYQKPPSRRHFTEAARKAAAAARAVKRAVPSRFGEPELFVVRASSGAMALTWEIRRFGGVLLQRGEIDFPNLSEAEAAGAEALDSLLHTPDPPTFDRKLRSRAGLSREPS